MKRDIQDIQELYSNQVAESFKEKTERRKREDAIDGFTQTLYCIQDRLPISVVSVNRIREHSYRGGYPPGMPFLGYEVATVLGSVDGTPYYYFRRGLYSAENNIPAMIVPMIVEVSPNKISETLIQGIIRNAAPLFLSAEGQEVHTCGFFIFRYKMPARSDKNQNEWSYIAMEAQSREAAIRSVVNREELINSLVRAEDINVYDDSGRWVSLKKIHSDKAGYSRITGRLPLNLAVGE